MKKTALLLVITILFSSTMPIFADNQTPSFDSDENIGITIVEDSSNDEYATRSNRFRYYYTETDFSYYKTATATEDDIDAAMKLAATELNIVFAISGVLVGRVVVTAALSNITRKKLVEVILKQSTISSYIAASAFVVSEGAGFITFKAIQTKISKKNKIKWRENLATGRVDKVAEWVTYKNKNYTRDDEDSDWEYTGTTTKTIKLR